MLIFVFKFKDHLVNIFYNTRKTSYKDLKTKGKMTEEEPLADPSRTIFKTGSELHYSFRHVFVISVKMK